MILNQSLNIIIIIAARLTSTRFPGKVLKTVGGVTMVRRVWLAAKAWKGASKVIVAWPERYPDIDENNVLARFRRIAAEEKADIVIRLTADCPLLTTQDIESTFRKFIASPYIDYYYNGIDGHDVQIISSAMLFDCMFTSTEHVIKDAGTPKTGVSVDDEKSLEYVRSLWKNQQSL